MCLTHPAGTLRCSTCPDTEVRHGGGIAWEGEMRVPCFSRVSKRGLFCETFGKKSILYCDDVPFYIKPRRNKWLNEQAKQ